MRDISLNKKNVLLVMPELYWGGAETQFRALVQGLDKQNFSLKVLVEHSKREKTGQDEQFISSMIDSVEFDELDPKNFSALPLKKQIKLLKTYFSESLLKGNDAVIIYGGISVLLIPWLRRKGLTVCYSDRNGGKDSLRQRIKSVFYNKANVIICNSRPTYTRRSKKHQNVVFIPNGTRVIQNSISSGYESNNLLMVSRVAKVKNIECAIEALCYLPEQFTITLLGKTEDEVYGAQLREQISKVRLENRFHFAGYESDIDQFFQDSFCTLLTSFEEGMPNAVLESWAHERIAIVSSIPANMELVKDSKWRFPCDSPEILAKRVKDLKHLSKEDYDRLSRECKRNVEAEYSIERMVKRFERTLESVTV